MMILDEKKESSLEGELREIADRLDVKTLGETFLFPKYFEIETYRGCNARCTMCTVNEWEDSNMRIKDGLFDKIADEMKGYANWIERVTLSRDGEPLMDKFLSLRIKKLKDSGIRYVTFSTNGSLLNEKRASELIDAGLDDIRFSVDGATKETFEAIRLRLNYEQVVGNYLKFIEMRDKGGKKPTIEVRMVVQERNKHEVDMWKEFWKPRIGHQDILYSKPMHSWGNQLKTYELHHEDEIYAEKPCISPWSTMAIHANGKVGLCGCDYHTVVPMGNLNEQSVREIWQSEPYQKARQIHESGKRNDIKICVGCNIWDLGVRKIYHEGMLKSVLD